MTTTPPDEDGVAAWLRYAPLPASTAANSPAIDTVVVLGEEARDETSPVATAGRELVDGISKILGRAVALGDASSPRTSSTLVIGTRDAFSSLEGVPSSSSPSPLDHSDGYWIDPSSSSSSSARILGHDARGVLYGAFAYLSKLAQGELSVESAAWGSAPQAPVRWINQWDNMDGSIERGYGGRSLFFEGGAVRDDLARVKEYARLMASVGLNGIVINNVNANASLLSEASLRDGVKRVADTMRPYGVRIGLALNFDAPRTLGGLATSDPLDAAVVEWWTRTTQLVYHYVPDLLGYTIKANSEGQPGPLSYGRTLAEGANLFARALAAHGDGLVFYRAFVYDHHLREDNPKNDRASAAVDFFAHLDGAFLDNVVVQVKFGPIDFQVREPVSPLLARLRKTKAAIEFMVAQEYMGQQTHAVYLAPQWQEVLSFDLRVDGKPSLVRDILSPAGPFAWPTTGYTAVVNVGRDTTWLGHHLAMANLYAYGRLAWAPASDARALLDEWTRLTWSTDAEVVAAVGSLLMDTWPAYEGHSGNLGIQTLCDILYTHYGPSPASQDGNGWGQWTRADATALGMDRTVATGTGFAGQYPREVAAVYEDPATTPDNLLLWFHHVPYTHPLKSSGKTVIQHFYDAHYEGAATVQTFPARWARLRGKVDDARWAHVAFKLAYQAGHALVWRDSVCRFYHALSGIADDKQRVNNYKHRIPLAVPSPNVRLDGYSPVDARLPEAASGGRAVQTASMTAPGKAAVTLNVVDGVYDLAVNYYDTSVGRARYTLSVNDAAVGSWQGNLQDRLGHDFSAFLDGHSATRIYFRGVSLKTGDVLTIVGEPDGDERAPLDYVSVLPVGVVD
ncbi:hypothetical protein SCUCBS95973_005424 [Sporothrix curviconia]|uniref:Alpha-glucuronidase n=1 Tax=Sporothrix curviconia TaxID=1260050 RepID=A0ABP0BWU2_9PEZI